MGTRDLSRRRNDAHTRPVHRLCAVVALTAFGFLSSPASAQNDTPLPANRSLVPVSNKSLAVQPEVRLPNFRMQNFMGRVFTPKMAAVGGLTTILAADASKQLTGPQQQAYNNNVISTQVLPRMGNAGLEALKGAVAGCVTGAAVGLLPAALTGGFSVAAGCLYFGVSGAVMNGINGASMPLDEAGTIVRNPDGSLSGSNVRTVSSAALTGNAEHFRFAQGAPASQYAQAFARYGFHRTFVCSTSNRPSEYSECMFFDAKNMPGRGGHTSGFFGYDDTFEITPRFEICAGPALTNTCSPGGEFMKMYNPGPGIDMSLPTPATGRKTLLIARVIATGTVPPTISARGFDPVTTSAFGGEHMTGQLPPEVGQLRVSSDALAAYMNGIWQNAAARGVPGIPPFTDANKITIADVNAAKQELPSAAPRIADLVAPYATVGKTPEGSSTNDQQKAAQDVNIVNTGEIGATGTSTTTKEADPETALDNDQGLLGDVMKPAKDFLTGTLAPWMTPDVQLPPAQCPVVSIDLPTLLGRQDISNPQDSSVMCDWMEEQRPKFLGLLHVMFIFLACRKAMSA